MGERETPPSWLADLNISAYNQGDRVDYFNVSDYLNYQLCLCVRRMASHPDPEASMRQLIQNYPEVYVMFGQRLKNFLHVLLALRKQDVVMAQGKQAVEIAAAAAAAAAASKPECRPRRAKRRRVSSADSSS